MNLEESNEFVEQMEKNNRNKKTVLVVLAICAVIIVILLMTIARIQSKDKQTLKMYVNGSQVTITSTLLLQSEDGSYYMNVKQLAELLGYSYQNGEYKNYTEDNESCYLKTDYEIISMSANSDTVTKYILNEDEELMSTYSTDLLIEDEETGEVSINIRVNSEDETQQIFTIDEPIQYVNNELYVSFAELPKIFSVSFSTTEYNSEMNRIYVNSIFYTISSLVNYANNLGYSEVSNWYENLMAIENNMLVVGNGSQYGVISLVDGSEIISLKYDEIIYRQNTEEFLVTAEDSVGIIDSEGNTIIKPTEYDSIANYDELYKLYLVEKNGKYGIINRNGDTVVYTDYDSIGLENTEEFADEDIRNFGLLFDECIPVVDDEKVGIIDIDGNEKLTCVYDSLGFIKTDETETEEEEEDDDDDEENTTNEVSTTTATTTDTNYNSLLTIPESIGIKGIVVCFNGLYGIYDAEVGHLIIPCACTKIYSRTKSGVTKYYLEYNNEEIDLEDYLEQNDLISINSDEDTIETIENVEE